MSINRRRAETRSTTSKREAEDQAAIERKHKVEVRVVQYQLPPRTIWHWASKMGTVSRCGWQGRALDDHGSTDRHVEKVNCPRCMKTKGYERAMRRRA